MEITTCGGVCRVKSNRYNRGYTLIKYNQINKQARAWVGRLESKLSVFSS